MIVAKATRGEGAGQGFRSDEGGSMRRAVVLGTITGVGMLSIAVTAYRSPGQGLSPQAVEATRIEKVRGNLYMITGSTPMPRQTFSGGNTGVFVTANGVIVVDTKLDGWGQVILDRIKSVTDKPVTMIINTHTHGDHTGSNAMFPPTVDIVAHENTKANMTKMDAFKGDNARFLPKRTYTDKLTIGSGKDRVDLYYFGRGHTNGDTWIVFPSVRVMQTGDMFAWKDAPGIDLSSGGSGLEYAATVGRALSTVHDVDTLIVGHSPLRTPAELKEYQQFMSDFVDAVKAAQQAGKSVEEATASIDLGAKYKDYTKERYQGAVQAIYDELTSQAR
jgi:cyclase